MSAQHELLHSFLPDGAPGPTAFNAIVRPVDCVDFLDANIEDGKRLFRPPGLPEQSGRGEWRVGSIRLVVSEDGSKYCCHFTTRDRGNYDFEEALDTDVVAKLATRILRTFKELA